MKITIYSAFSKEQKHLRKRYKNINKDIIKLINELQENPLLGTDLGNGIRKIRMKISDKGKGKSGGARVITCIVDIDENTRELGLHYIYDKSERESISDKELNEIIKSNFSL